ncbi:Oidioi.mRNA.OKI2018_I69.XSR.g14147.t1.cds [Oikopleura dioica]|uniref:Oidioi.mRNA.OKI2018_I69.XSR.g14147.t1.cds n=1 Tax=Oikopleura dioica TaxID=34765 RepID=A0ABN7S8Y7_OIKDI|nr:Oidioi.mRNA.OKI2018_I69.XSR.g14147.t1.cds [Oikopleura dioica]
MVSEYIRGQSDLRALSLLEELKYVLLQQDMHIAKQAIEIERLNKENEKLRGDITRLKETPKDILFCDADMNSAPNSPKAERREEDMKFRSPSNSATRFL